jgi:hypothetical protein
VNYAGYQGDCTSLRFDYLPESKYMRAQEHGPDALRKLPLRTLAQKAAAEKRAAKLVPGQERLPRRRRADDGAVGEWALFPSLRRHGRPVYVRKDQADHKLKTPLDRKKGASKYTGLAERVDGPLGPGYLYMYSTDGAHWGIGPNLIGDLLMCINSRASHPSQLCIAGGTATSSCVGGDHQGSIGGTSALADVVGVGVSAEWLLWNGGNERTLNHQLAGVFPCKVCAV